MGGNLRIFDLQKDVSSHLSPSTTQEENSFTMCLTVYQFLIKPLPCLEDYYLIRESTYSWTAVILLFFIELKPVLFTPL